MNFLEEKILAEGSIRPGNILRMDSFLNHQIDIKLTSQLAYELKRRFGGAEVTKILTIEASGIAIATMLGYLYNVPVVFAKKAETVNCPDDKFVAQAYSFTHKEMNNVMVSRLYLHATDKVLIVDDVLADGQAALALIDLVHQAGGEVVGVGIAVEKGLQKGGRLLREMGYHVESVAIVKEMDSETQSIKFHGHPMMPMAAKDGNK